VLLQARSGIPTGRADVGLEPCKESVAFLRAVRKDFEKVQHLLQLIIDREKLKSEQVCLLLFADLTMLFLKNIYHSRVPTSFVKPDVFLLMRNLACLT